MGDLHFRLTVNFYEPEVSSTFDPAAIVRACIESGSPALLLDAPLPPSFFDLSSGVAGDLVHRLTLYQLPMAAVVPDLSAHSAYFQDFAREANRRQDFRFFPTRQEALAWLESQTG